MIETDIEAPYIEDPGEPSAFTEFMAAYPKQENRIGALREWWRIRPTLELQAKIMRSLRALKMTDRWRGGFAPDARNFLRDRRWKDADGLPQPAEPRKVALRIEEEPQPVEFHRTPPEVAKSLMRQGVIEGWLRDHPGREAPEGLLTDPIGFVTSAIKRI